MMHSPAMNETQITKNAAEIIEANKMSAGMARYWNSKAIQLAPRVAAVDPFRTPLRVLRASRPDLLGRSVYRASTGGRWGKSAQIVTL